MRKLMASLFTSALLFGGLAGSASAQVQQDGLVNVNIGDVTITDTIDAAVLAVANVCPNVNVGAVAILANNVDAGRVRQVTLCRAEGDRVTITNN
jgi:hypothetical protein